MNDDDTALPPEDFESGKGKPKRPRFVTVDTFDERDRELIASLFDLTPMPRMSKDLREAAKLLSDDQARYLVSAYYTQQKNRIRAAHQQRMLIKQKVKLPDGTEESKPHAMVTWLARQNEILENQVKGALNVYSAAHKVGTWARSITGIGPVICAGLLAGLDIKKAPTAGHFWRICGLNPEDKKRKGEKLVWDPVLKRLCWILGESFTKVSTHPEDYYGKIYLARKSQEILKNDTGAFADQAKLAIETRDFSKDTLAKLWYSACFPMGFCTQYNNLETTDERTEAIKATRGAPGSGVAMLPPARIQLRSQRYAVKMFLADLHAVWYEIEHGKPAPMPYVIAHGGHVHHRGPPNWPIR